MRKRNVSPSAPVALVGALLLFSAVSLEAAGSKPKPTLPEPPSAKSPDQLSVERFNSGLKHRDKAWDLEKKASLALGDEQEKLFAKARKQYEKAIADQREATELNPSFHEAWSSLGYAYRKTGDLDKALEAYDQALALAPAYGEAIEYRAEAYLGLHRIEDAKKAYMQLFAADRSKADELMDAIRRWLEARSEDPAGVSAEDLDDLRAWVRERHRLRAQLEPTARHGW